MKKLISIFVALVIVAAILFLALPKYFSTQTNQYLHGFLHGLEQVSNGRVTGKVTKMTEGWFRSDATVEIEYKFTVRNKMSPAKNIAGKMDLNLVSHYGPLLMTNSGLRFGKAYISYNLKNNEPSANYFAKHFNDPLIKGNATVSLSGDTYVELSGFQAGLQAAKNHMISFAGLKTDFTINQQLTKSQGTIHFDQLQITAPNDNKESISFAPFTQTFNMTRPTANDLWSGSKVTTFPSIVISSPDFNAQFNGVTLKSNTTVDQKILNGNLIIDAPAFSANKYTGNFHAEMTLKDLDAAAIKKLHDLAHSIRNQNLSAQQIFEMNNKIFGFMIEMFSGKSSAQFNSKLSVNKLGNFVLNTGYDNSEPESKINFTVQMNRTDKTIAGVDLKIDGLNKTALGKILHAAIELKPNGNTTPAFQEVKAKLIRLIPGLFTLDSQINLTIMLPEDKNSGFQLLNAKAYFNQLPQNPNMGDLINKTQLDANWKIPTYATDMLELFAPVIISKMKTVDEQIEAKSAYDIFKKMIPLMIQQGYLQQQGPYYISHWNISNTAILMNNKPVQPLLMEIEKMQPTISTP
jgi:hypothetical protein